MPYSYKCVQLAQGIVLKKIQTGQEVAEQLEKLVNQMAAQGWEFQRMDQFINHVKPGCLGLLMGAKEETTTIYVATFRRPV